MATDEVSAAGTLADDNWHNILEILSLPMSSELYMMEGFLNVLTFAAVCMLVPVGAAAPVDNTLPGVTRLASSMSTFGPALSPYYKGYPLHRLYVRNNVAGSNAAFALEGVARRD